MKFKKKEDQSVDTSILLRRGNKIPMEGVTVTKFGAEMEGMTVQRLPHLVIHPIKTAFSTNGAGTTGCYHVEECELIHSYLLVLKSNLSGLRNST